MKNVEIITTRQKLAAGGLGVGAMLLLCALIIATCGCATGPEVRPFTQPEIGLESEQVGWEQPRLPQAPRSPFAFRAPIGTVEMGPPVVIRVEARNGSSKDLVMTLRCGEEGHRQTDTDVAVQARTARAVYYSFPPRAGRQTFGCFIARINGNQAP